MLVQPIHQGDIHSLMMQPDIHLSTGSAQFRELGQRYFHYWGNDSLHLAPDEHRDIRIALCRVIRNIPTDGAVAFCGTGPRIAQNRDLDSTLVGGHLADHQELVFADFSQNMLASTLETIQNISHTVAAHSHLVIRDFSRNNLGAKFDALMRNQINAIRNVDDMNTFIQRLKETVGLEEIRRQPLEQDHGSIDPRLIAKPDTQQGLQFNKVLFEQRPIRLIVANLLITGMFAVTEMDFREKLAWLRRADTQHMTEEKMIECLAAWHALILTLNEKVGQEFIEDALHANDDLDCSTPTIFLSADDTVTYNGLQRFDRLRMGQLQQALPEDVTLREIDRAHWDHSHESIPHKHSLSVAVVAKNK